MIQFHFIRSFLRDTKLARCKLEILKDRPVSREIILTSVATDSTLKFFLLNGAPGASYQKQKIIPLHHEAELYRHEGA